MKNALMKDHKIFTYPNFDWFFIFKQKFNFKLNILNNY